MSYLEVLIFAVSLVCTLEGPESVTNRVPGLEGFLEGFGRLWHALEGFEALEDFGILILSSIAWGRLNC